STLEPRSRRPAVVEEHPHERAEYERLAGERWLAGERVAWLACVGWLAARPRSLGARKIRWRNANRSQCRDCVAFFPPHIDGPASRARWPGRMENATFRGAACQPWPATIRARCPSRRCHG